MIRILHIELGRHLYGGAKQVTYLLKGFSPYNDIENHLLCPVDSEIARVKLSNCTLHTINYKGELDVFAVKKILDTAKQVHADIIHIHSRRGADVYGAFVAKLTNIPVICTRRVDNVESKIAGYKYRQFAAVVSISKGVYNVVDKHCQHVPHKAIIHSAVDLDEFQQNEHREWLCNRYSIPHNHFVIANFAQLIARKGQADIIVAMQHVLQKLPNVTCLLFGKGKLKSRYQALINNLDLHNNVKLCGFTEMTNKILPSVDLVVHPAYAEGLGVIILQSGACKRAVVSTEVGGIPEIIQHKNTGLTVTPGCADQIANAITTLALNNNLRTELGNNLYAHVDKNFNINNMAKQYYTLYLKVVGVQN